MKKRTMALAVSCSLLGLACNVGLAAKAETTTNATPNGATTTTSTISTTSTRAAQEAATDEYRLRLHNLHTGESIDVAYRRGQQYLGGGIGMLNHFLRDYRTNENAHYPTQEFDLLHALLIQLHKPDAVIDIICGYRTPKTNAYLRGRSANTGVAENSQHIQSKAIDLRVPGVTTERLRDAALSLGMGGVGYYPQSGFVHVDVGPLRTWSFGAGHAVRTTQGSSDSHHHPAPA